MCTPPYNINTETMILSSYTLKDGVCQSQYKSKANLKNLTHGLCHFLIPFNVREDPPVPEAPFFTRDMYEKYSLAPSIMELWASLQRYVKE